MPGRPLRDARTSKADLTLVETSAGPVIVKDFRRRSAFARLAGRIQIARECRAYARLGERPGLPRFLGRIDRHALAVEWVPGRALPDAPERVVDGVASHERLCEVVAGLHEAGAVHWDLRARDNVLFGDAGQVWVVDLASAVCLRPGGVPHRLLFRFMTLVDRSALLKWKSMLRAGEYTPAESAFLQRFGLVRRLWIFNRKRRADTR